MSAVTTNLALVRTPIVSADGRKIILRFPGTEYELYLDLAMPLPSSSARDAAGVIRARARRVDVVETGGRYVEPLQGPPRRVQGTILAADATANTLTVACAPGCRMVCELTAGQRAGDLAVGALVAFELDGRACFQPM
jgi:hypothetical protein